MYECIKLCVYAVCISLIAILHKTSVFMSCLSSIFSVLFKNQNECETNRTEWQAKMIYTFVIDFKTQKFVSVK